MPEMKAALQQVDGTFRIRPLPVPQPGPDEVLIRVRAAGICGSDLHEYGSKVVAETLPAGHELAGEIVETGVGVEASRVGERVAIDGVQASACGRCWFCVRGQTLHCQDKSASGGGGFAEHVVRGARGCCPLPDTLSWEEGALVEPTAVSVHGMRRGRLERGETVAVLGAGNIGLTAVAAARAMGAGKVYVTARHTHQAEMARRLGADEVVAPDGDALREALLEGTDGRGADVTVETVGGESEATITQAMAVTRSLGRVVVLGVFTRPLTLDWKQPLLHQQEVLFAGGYDTAGGQSDYQRTIDFIASGRAPVRQMVTHRFPLAETGNAFETASDKGTGSIKVQVIP